MSSEGSLSSNSSPIRQFGFYRTIDARTEEFLRLSRKRQLRQGCACAAVSTAITVTVVVSVILVYEYGINSELNSNSKFALRSNWLGLMNDSSDDNIFDAKLSKNKLNLDRTTLKLLPILIKALNQNGYIEKIIGDYSSSSPAYDKKETTENNDKRDVTPDDSNWFKMHTPKLYAIEYKTSPVVYYRSPKKSSEYFTKIRKIRDYQRIFNYVDKMINEKVGFSSTIPMMTGKFSQSEKPPLKQYTVPIKSRIFQTVGHKARSVVSSRKRVVKESKDTTKCNCPKKIKDLLNRLIASIQKILPKTNTNQPSLTSCTDENPSAKQQSKINFISILKPKTSPFNYKISTTTPKLAFMTDTNSAFSKIGLNNDLAIIQKESLYRKTINMASTGIKPIFDTYDSNKIIFNVYRKPTTTTNAHMEATLSGDRIPTTTKSISYMKYSDNFINHAMAETKKTGGADITNKKSILSGDEYDDYFATTANIINQLDKHNSHLKTKLLVLDKDKTNKNKETVEIFIDKKNVSKSLTDRLSSEISYINNVKSNQDNIISQHSTNILYNLSDAKNFDYDSPQTFINNNSEIHSIRKINQNTPSKLKSEGNVSKSSLKKQYKPELTTTKSRLENKNITQINIRYWKDQKNKYENIKYGDQTQAIDNALLEEYVERGNEEYLEEYRQFYNTIENIAKSNNSVTIQQKSDDRNYNTLEKPDKNNNSDGIKNKSDISTENIGGSMLPSSRPVYLEISRNDWVHDETQDFDININHDLFDLPNP